MRRREFIAGLGAAAWPLTARAQQRPLPVIGFLSSGAPHAYSRYLNAFRQGLAETGYVEGQNFAVEFRWAEGVFDRLPALASDLVQRRVAVIVTTGTTSALAAKAAAETIPVVFLGADDPVQHGLVASLNRPGGNATGLNVLTSELTGKRLGMLRELVPSATVVAILANPKSPEAEPQLRDLRIAASAIGYETRILNASTELDIEEAFATLVQQRDRALLVTNDAFLVDRSAQIVALAARYAVPAIYDRREYAAAGGPVSYGTHYFDAYRLLGVYTGQILRGTKPADLPVQQSIRMETVLNLKTAKALGLTIPASLISLADEVIE